MTVRLVPEVPALVAAAEVQAVRAEVVAVVLRTAPIVAVRASDVHYSVVVVAIARGRQKDTVTGSAVGKSTARYAVTGCPFVFYISRIC